MKNIFGSFVLLILFGALLIFITDTEVTSTDLSASQPCSEPLTYQIGNIDPRFNISEQQVVTIMKEVEELWETASERDLLNRHEEGKVAINMIYSKEQKRSEEEQLFSNKIQTNKDQVKATRSEYQRLTRQFEQEESDFKNTVTRYNQLADSYNELAKELQGQDPSNEKLDELNKLEIQLKKLESNIERKQINLESLRKQTNTKSEQLNGLVKEQRRMITRYNNEFGGVKRFDQGQFIKQGTNETIKVLQFSNRSELKTVLAHEIGHALGLGHINNPTSIMYHKIGKQNIFDLELSDEDITAIKDRCKN